ncbi:VOC family protein [Rhodocytophaga rosea]|uniref:VOC family protein n=1 Tax=Rhodocytophaga rosea TaxID=2704465 RepID=A0A6C0GSM5_9BACT|nr:VOC family protein [Rhodocytophaga rosea]QHT70460.1 VOC family protein [Rhodocytophaga rosea]
MSTFQLPADTKIGYIHLQTAQLDRLLSFYVDLLGFKEIKRENNTSWLSANGQLPALIELTENKQASARNRHTPGLFHTAFLLSSRFALAQLLKRLLENNFRLGYGDHGVSEALYLSDPDGNGVELYADRPRDQWPIVNGKIEMYTEPVDTKSLLAELNRPNSEWKGIDHGTLIGHVHLQVSSLNKAEQFYHHILGFDITQQSYPGALFVSAGGYHHHLGLNTWYSKNSPPAPADSTGLQSFSIVVSDEKALTGVKQQLSQAGYAVNTTETGISTFDEDTIHVLVDRA